MITFATGLAILAGLCIGVVAADARVPRPRIVPAACSAGLAVIGAASLCTLRPAALIDAIALVATAVLSTVIYAAVAWRRTWPDSPFTLGRLMILDLTHPGTVARAY